MIIMLLRNNACISIDGSLILKSKITKEYFEREREINPKIQREKLIESHYSMYLFRIFLKYSSFIYAFFLKNIKVIN